VVPKALRDELDIHGRQELEIAVRDGRLELEPPSVPMHLERRGDVVVAVPDGPVVPLTSEMVRETLERARR
jgi:bifunctional DNA-binding transcriptional regulator/antitoxin component of YhaV-PrlF toxin-antitoxin module